MSVREKKTKTKQDINKKKKPKKTGYKGTKPQNQNQKDNIIIYNEVAVEWETVSLLHYSLLQTQQG